MGVFRYPFSEIQKIGDIIVVSSSEAIIDIKILFLDIHVVRETISMIFYRNRDAFETLGNLYDFENKTNTGVAHPKCMLPGLVRVKQRMCFSDLFCALIHEGTFSPKNQTNGKWNATEQRAWVISMRILVRRKAQGLNFYTQRFKPKS